MSATAMGPLINTFGEFATSNKEELSFKVIYFSMSARKKLPLNLALLY